MVKHITTLGRSGLYDWLIQRVSAVVLAVASVVLTVFIIKNYPVGFDVWSTAFDVTWVKILTFVTILSLIAHAWVGLWQVLTDYVKCAWLRLLMQIAVILLSVVYTVWTAQILWA